MSADRSAAGRAFVGLGSNLGDRRALLDSAIARLDARPGCRVRRVSPWLENAAVGGPPGQPDYLNGVLELETSLPPRELLAALHEIELEHGRDRSHGIADAPRPLDLDLLLYDDRVIDEPGLVVPHPRMLERDFVMAPLARIARDVRLPGSGLTVGEAAHRLALARIAEPLPRGVERSLRRAPVA